MLGSKPVSIVMNPSSITLWNQVRVDRVMARQVLIKISALQSV
jgi:hypothetical protein